MEEQEVLAARERENLALLQALREIKVQSARIESDCEAMAARLAYVEAEKHASERESSDARLEKCLELVKSHAEQRISLQQLVAAVQDLSGSRDEEFYDAASSQNASNVESGVSHQAIDYWRIRAAKMEQLLHVAVTKNLEFEDTIARLEVQVRTMASEWEAHHQDQATGQTETTKDAKHINASKAQGGTSTHQAPILDRHTRLSESQVEKLKKENARLRSATQRKAELLGFEKQKTEALRQQLDAVTRSTNDLATAQSQLSELKARVKEQVRQLQELRSVSSAYHDDNVQLSFRLQQIKQEHDESAKRMKALSAENQRLRSEIGTVSNPNSSMIALNGSNQIGLRKPLCSKCSGRATGEYESFGDEEVKALRRRVLQKQELLVQSKAKIISVEEELAAERATTSRLTSINRQLQQRLKVQLANSTNELSHVQAESKKAVLATQKQLNGLRASVFDVFEAFACCQPMKITSKSATKSATKSANATNQESVDVDSSGDENLDKAKRWTEFSTEDLAALCVMSSKRNTAARERYWEKLQSEAKAAVKSLGIALDEWPQDCRNELCQVIQVLLDQCSSGN